MQLQHLPYFRRVCLHYRGIIAVDPVVSKTAELYTGWTDKNNLDHL